ncbi:CDP-alcohol phosphatidyltransferase family protein [Myxococcota bacterium]|nr:CDP-alcohol phosphatidyltransferase family protein [Myxococcota bacterium]
MQFLVLPARGEFRERLLGLTLEERARRMLRAAGLAEASEWAGAGPLVIFPGERVGPGALGKEIAAVEAGPEAVVALDPASGAGGRPVLVLGEAARNRLAAGAGDLDGLLADALAAVGERRPIRVPTAEVLDRRGAAGARALLLQALRKPIDGLVSRTLNRPVSIRISALLSATPLTPNHLSVISFVIALLGALGMAAGHFVIGALVMHVASVLDGCDGEIARLKYQSSRIGGWLDTVFDDVSNNLFALATGVGLWRVRSGDGTGQVLLGLAVAGFLLAVPTVATTYRRLVRRGTSDSGALDYSGGESASALRRAVTRWLAPLVKRDTYLLIFLGMAIAGIPWAIVVFYFLGALGAAATLLSDRAALREAWGPR